MTEQDDGLKVLVEAIEISRLALRKLRTDGSHHFLLAALAGYLWSAIGTAETIVAVVLSGAGQGAGPLKRFLHETYIDVLFLCSDPDPDLLAAKTILIDYRGTLRLLSEYREVLDAHPQAGLPSVPEAWKCFDRPVPDAIAALDLENVRDGGELDLFSRAWASLEASRYWHWSGISRKRMIDALVSRGKLGGSAAGMAMSLVNMYNAEAHPAPSWSELPIPEEQRGLDPPRMASAADLKQLAVGAHQFLSGITAEVVAAFELIKSPSAFGVHDG